MCELMLFKDTRKLRLDVCIETQKYSDVYLGFARTMQFSHPPPRVIGEIDERRHGTQNFAS